MFIRYIYISLHLLFIILRSVSGELCPNIIGSPFTVEEILSLDGKKWDIDSIIATRSKMISLFSIELKADFYETLFICDYNIDSTPEDVKLSNIGIILELNCNNNGNSEEIVTLNKNNSNDLSFKARYETKKCINYPQMIEYKIIGTDFESFLILYGCQEIQGTDPYDFGLWILNGTEDFNKENAIEILKRYEIPTENLTRFVNGNCSENSGLDFYEKTCRMDPPQVNYIVSISCVISVTVLTFLGFIIHKIYIRKFKQTNVRIIMVAPAQLELE